MEALQANLSKINVPTQQSSVYKDECAFSYQTPESDGGLFVDMNSFIGFSPQFALLNFQRTGNAVYLNICKKRVPKKKTDSDADKAKAKGALGLFFDRDTNYDIETTLSIVLLPDYSRIELPNIDIPTKVDLAVNAIMTVNAATQKQQVSAFVLGADELFESKYAKELIQLDNGVKISKQGWKCEKCDKTQNLWLNLSDGMILCGRVIYGSDAGGNGHALAHYKDTGFPLVVKLGTINGSADKNNIAEVYSYATDEDDSVLDPYLEKHLLHWGIDLKAMKKTEKTVAEMEAELQLSYEFSAVLGNSLSSSSPLYGPGFTGLLNMGNTCYMNSVLQVLFSTPSFVQRYHENAANFFDRPLKPAPEDFLVQFAKVARGLCSGEHAKPPTAEEIREEEERRDRLLAEAKKNEEAKQSSSSQMDGIESSDVDNSAGAGQAAVEKKIDENPLTNPDDFPKFSERGIKPVMFKHLVGQGHAEFSTNRQQDAQEFYTYLMELITRAEFQRGDKDVNGEKVADPTQDFRFGVETRVECSMTQQVAYSSEITPFLTLPVPFSEALNKADVEAYEEKLKKDDTLKNSPVLAQYTLDQCLKLAFADVVVDDWFSPAAQQKTAAFKRNRLATFPSFLTLHISKFRYDEGWVPKKVLMELQVPDELDLSALRAKGLTDGEVLLPTDAASPASTPSAPAATSAPAEPMWDQHVVDSLMEMGIPVFRAQRASNATRGEGMEAALNWAFSHGEDPDVDLPLEAAAPKAASTAAPAAPAAAAVSEDSIANVMDMGFDRKKATKALKQTGGDIERAVEWLFSHPEDDGEEDVAAPAAASEQPKDQTKSADAIKALPDGKGRYELFAFICHMGTSTMSGHYLVYIKKDGKWALFNDEKVNEVAEPPKGHGYLYFYRRLE